MSTEASTSTTSTEASTYTMSAEASTSTASTSGASASGSEYSKFPKPYSELEAYCSPFNAGGMFLIEEFALNRHKLQELAEESSKKNHEESAQQQVVDELQEKIDALRKNSGPMLEIIEFEADLVIANGILSELEKEMRELFERYFELIGENATLREVLKEKDPKLYIPGSSGDNSEVMSLMEHPSFEKCLGYFLDRLSK
ncbi:hypothetical protein BATDEDRAFT_87160 [Batrachochytrium dendrobatidis JAM81]|uniref:Uncharacterized protein n=2 Tax=Batrachochytrium dendrobatidis TaxID=109871 RepID=F4NYM1_BATDJ|nr:uncharacterized protein BATDEDRAFT_87160 [Batrachochytrium dendrobatidis JAM81]EGF82052.1 hypothetical protein BATDEDRAFT_87160 [Batrachochytrium dendrobatidis JAM81]OAJ40192.1 hypothetical protein BDEG_23956 [Batrachochytrium dendrobatidis JEL423]|eukprot:XP_006677619.1 hypothetical protein BATDEDRAFT_87160 [Batrachochytrium dendrobatidis JAM81]